MQIIVADIGNSSIKYTLAAQSPDDSAPRAIWDHCRACPVDRLSQMAAPADHPSQWIVSSVNPHNLNQLKALADRQGTIGTWNEVQHADIPLEIDVEEPNSVGIDRLLAATASSQLAESRDCIVIDCGTALTIDLVDRNRVFRGGVIVAGPSTALKALAFHTAALPDLSQEELSETASIIGKSTRQAVLSGAYFAQLGAIKQIVSEMSLGLSTDPLVVGTGGGLGLWRGRLPSQWIVVDNLVLDGILFLANKLLERAETKPKF